MRNVSRLSAKALNRVGFRARIVAILIAAGAPGVVFGALEANRAFNLAIERRTEEANFVRDRVQSRLNEAFIGSTHLVGALSNLPSVVGVRPDCGDILASSLKAARRYAAGGRLDRDGRLVCSSTGGSADLGKASWFLALKSGQRFTVSALRYGELSQVPVLMVAAPVLRNGVFDGAVAISLRQDWLASVIEQERGDDIDQVVLIDNNGAIVAMTMRRDGARSTVNDPQRDLVRAELAGGALHLFVLPNSSKTLIGLRSALVVAAPLLVIGLAALAAWATLQMWVLRWFSALQARVKSGVRDVSFDGAPAEIASLAETFDDTMRQAEERQAQLAAAAENNWRLTRDLHHHVKNNLQVLLSLLSRQQKRAVSDVGRQTVAESRCRALAVSLVHRFLDPPEHLGVIDLDAYLAEMVRQSHAALYNGGRRAQLVMEIDPGEADVPIAMAAGLIVAETLVGGAQLKGSQIKILVQWRDKGHASASLTVRVTSDEDSSSLQLDRELIEQLARQAGAEVRIGPDGIVADFATHKAEAKARETSSWS